MKRYEKPEIEISKFEVEDSVTVTDSNIIRPIANYSYYEDMDFVDIFAN